MAHGEAQIRRRFYVYVCQRAFLLRVHIRPYSFHGHSPHSKLPGAANVQYFRGPPSDLRVRSAVNCVLNWLVCDPAILVQTNLRSIPTRSQRREAQDWQKRRLNNTHCLRKVLKLDQFFSFTKVKTTSSLISANFFCLRISE